MKREWIIEGMPGAAGGDALFPETPACVHDALRMAASDIRRYQLRMPRRRRGMAWAAACAVLLAGAALALRPWQDGRHGDVVAPPVLTERDAATAMPEYLREQVFASKDDPCYHLRSDCPRAVPGAVPLPRLTAEAFEKAPCPECAGWEE